MKHKTLSSTFFNFFVFGLLPQVLKVLLKTLLFLFDATACLKFKIPINPIQNFIKRPHYRFLPLFCASRLARHASQRVLRSALRVQHRRHQSFSWGPPFKAWTRKRSLSSLNPARRKRVGKARVTTRVSMFP